MGGIPIALAVANSTAGSLGLPAWLWRNQAAPKPGLLNEVRSPVHFLAEGTVDER